MRILFVGALGLLVRFAAAQTGDTGFTVVSAGSFAPVVAADSFVSVFGRQLSSGTETATPTADGDLPGELAGTVVEFGGVRAGLQFVSPGQINCVVPPGTAAGAVEVLVRNLAAGVTLRGTARVAAVAPALFSSGASGQGAGAILNGITFAGAPFAVETVENPGADLRTRIAAYGTGFRNAAARGATVQAQARTSGGELFPLTVEYAGKAPVYPGLDQVNLILPAEADVDGDVELRLVAGTTASNAVTMRMQALPQQQLRAAAIELPRRTARPGETFTARVRLNGRAPRGGALVLLSSSDTAVRVPQTITVAGGEVAAAFQVQVTAVTDTRTVRLRAEYQTGAEATADIDVLSAVTPRLTSLTLSRSTAIAGATVTAVIALSAAAPLSGQTVFLESSSPATARVPAQVSVPFGRTQVEVDIVTAAGAASLDVTIAVSLAEDRREAVLAVRAPLSLEWIPKAVVGGGTVRLSIQLGEAPAAGAIISLSADDTAVMVPATVTIARGQTAAAVNVATTTVPATRVVTAYANSLGLAASAELTLSARAPAAVESVELTPEVVRGGAPANGVVRLNEPAPVGGAVVTLSSSDVLAARVAGFVVVPAGATSAGFSVQTFAVAATRRVTIAASWSGSTRSAVLTVN